LLTKKSRKLWRISAPVILFIQILPLEHVI